MTHHINRRSLVKGSAWAAPAVAATALVPAYAASMCSPDKEYTWTWTGFTATTTRTSSNQRNEGRKTDAASGLTVSVAHVANGRYLQGVDTMPSPVGSFGGESNYLFFQTSNNNRTVGRRSTITITFSKPVYNLSFPILDIDRQSGAWEDHVVVDGAPFTVRSMGSAVRQNGNEFIGAATVGSPARNGNVILDFAGPVTELTIGWSNGREAGSQNIGIGMMTYCAL